MFSLPYNGDCLIFVTKKVTKNVQKVLDLNLNDAIILITKKVIKMEGKE